MHAVQVKWDRPYWTENSNISIEKKKKKTDLGCLTEGRPFGNTDYPAERLYYSGFSRETKLIGCIRIWKETYYKAAGSHD